MPRKKAVHIPQDINALSEIRTDEFINLVKSFPNLYDVNNSTYKDTTCKDGIWEEIGLKFPELAKRGTTPEVHFTALRKVFTRERGKPAPSGSSAACLKKKTWAHLPAMNFMDIHIQARVNNAKDRNHHATSLLTISSDDASTSKESSSIHSDHDYELNASRTEEPVDKTNLSLTASETGEEICEEAKPMPKKRKKKSGEGSDEVTVAFSSIVDTTSSFLSTMQSKMDNLHEASRKENTHGAMFAAIVEKAIDSLPLEEQMDFGTWVISEVNTRLKFGKNVPSLYENL